ncbi:hypothetical protein ACU686_14340 [Yinghuangia aomiensis]
MAEPPSWAAPWEVGARRHSIFADVQLWDVKAGMRTWSCPFLASVWQLAHLWMPSPTPSPLTALFWSGFEQDPGFTRQWSAVESRVHRTIAARSFALLPFSPVCRRGGG